jgi:hypothetical protein
MIIHVMSSIISISKVEASTTDKVRELAFSLGGVMAAREMFFLQRETTSKESVRIFNIFP